MMRGTVMSDVEIIAEQALPAGWAFEAQWIDADTAALRATRITLTWADYNLWSPDGSDEPANVAAAALRFWLRHDPDQVIPAAFDAAILRRKFAGADEQITALI